VKVHALTRRVGDVGRVERRRKLPACKLDAAVHVEHKRGVRHREHVELVADDQR
jgi:hypothetical protein